MNSLTKMTLEEAQKAVLDNPSEENYLCIQFGWNNTLILPWEQGMLMVESMKTAQKLSNKEKDVPIKDITGDTISFYCISGNDYREMKMATLMGMSLSDFKDMINPKPPITEEDIPF